MTFKNSNRTVTQSKAFKTCDKQNKKADSKGFQNEVYANMSEKIIKDMRHKHS